MRDVDAVVHEHDVRDLQRLGQRDAEHLEDELAPECEAGEHDEAGERGLACHALAPCGVCALSDGEKRRNGGERIDEEEDGTESQHREAHQRGLAQLVQRHCGWIGVDHC